MGAPAALHGLDLTAEVRRHGSTWTHRLLVDGQEADLRNSRTRRYTHVLVVMRAGPVAMSWHLTEGAAIRARNARGEGRVIAIAEAA